MNKPNLMEAVDPGSGQYSFKTDLRLNAWLGLAGAVYLITQALLSRHPGWDPALRGLLVLTPLAPGLLYVRSWVRFIRGLDELQRRIQLEAFLFSALSTVILSAVIGSLNAQGVPTGLFKHGLGLGAAFMALLFFWSVGWGIAKCRYK
ncbi:MAG TPA: hypothetical protein VHN79_11740 [Lacunisphaera sp.]|nr:hypothetical protein [Lacunisphaera sp.]